MRDDIFKGLVTDLEDSFDEIDSNISTTLLERDEEYAALRTRIGVLEQQFPIEKWLEGKGALTLSADEHAALAEYMSVTFNVERKERMNLYLTGHKDCFAYLKRIGLL